jgi:hypothetical protein
MHVTICYCHHSSYLLNKIFDVRNLYALFSKASNTAKNYVITHGGAHFLDFQDPALRDSFQPLALKADGRNRKLEYPWWNKRCTITSFPCCRILTKYSTRKPLQLHTNELHAIWSRDITHHSTSLTTVKPTSNPHSLFA